MREIIITRPGLFISICVAGFFVTLIIGVIIGLWLMKKYSHDSHIEQLRKNDRLENTIYDLEEKCCAYAAKIKGVMIALANEGLVDAGYDAFAIALFRQWERGKK